MRSSKQQRGKFDFLTEERHYTGRAHHVEGPSQRY